MRIRYGDTWFAICKLPVQLPCADTLRRYRVWNLQTPWVLWFPNTLVSKNVSAREKFRTYKKRRTKERLGPLVLQQLLWICFASFMDLKVWRKRMTCLEKRVNILIFPWFYFSTVKKFGLTKKRRTKERLGPLVLQQLLWLFCVLYRPWRSEGKVWHVNEKKVRILKFTLLLFFNGKKIRTYKKRRTKERLGPFGSPDNNTSY